MSDKRRKWVLITIMSAFFMDLIDTTIVNVAIPSIQQGLGASYSAVQWIVAGYSLAFALLLITGGRLGDIFGYKKLFLSGLAGFTLGSILSGAASDPGLLIAARVFQGAMAAIMVPQILSTIQVMYKPHERAGVTSLYGAIGGLAATIGPLVGAFLLKTNMFHWGWRVIFLVNVPIGVIAFVAALFILPNAKSPKARRLDLIGMGIVLLALLSLMYPLLQGRELGWPAWTFASMAASLPLLGLFVLYERRKTRRNGSPLVVLDLFGERSFAVGVLVTICFQSTVTGFFLLLTLLLQIGLGFSAIVAGLTTLPFSIAIGMSTGLSAKKFTPAIGRYVLTIGALVMAAGMGVFLLDLQHTGTLLDGWKLIPALTFFGFGMGMIIAPLMPFMLTDVPVEHAGSASGLLSTFQQVGSSVGVALMGVVFFGLIGSYAVTSAQAEAPQIRRALASEHVSSDAQNQIVQTFVTCFHDSANQKDTSATPASCRQNSTTQESKAGVVISAAAKFAAADATKRNFVAAAKPTAVLEIGLLVLTASLTFFLPKKAPESSTPLL